MHVWPRSRCFYSPSYRPPAAWSGAVTATLGYRRDVRLHQSNKCRSALVADGAASCGARPDLPVRVAALSISEKLYDATLLNPTHVEAQISLRVLTSGRAQISHGPSGASPKSPTAIRKVCVKRWRSPIWRTRRPRSLACCRYERSQVSKSNEPIVCPSREANRRNTIPSNREFEMFAPNSRYYELVHLYRQDARRRRRHRDACGVAQSAGSRRLSPARGRRPARPARRSLPQDPPVLADLRLPTTRPAPDAIAASDLIGVPNGRIPDEQPLRHRHRRRRRSGLRRRHRRARGGGER